MASLNEWAEDITPALREHIKSSLAEFKTIEAPYKAVDSYEEVITTVSLEAGYSWVVANNLDVWALAGVEHFNMKHEGIISYETQEAGAAEVK